MKYFKIIFFCILTTSIFPKETGICYEWSEGDAQHLDTCKPSSLAECSKNKKSIANTETSFQNYKGKLFAGNGDSNSIIFEYKKGKKQDCERQLILAAREAEFTMCGNWGKAVYSSGLHAGESAFIYGKSVNAREKASLNSKKVFSPRDRLKVKIIGKSSEMDSIENLYSAYWFKISVNGKSGWIYGQFIHPNPESKNEYIE